MRIWVRARRLGVVGLVGLLAASLTAPPAAASRLRNPRIFIASKNGPIVVPIPDLGLMGSLPLPDGRWIVVATLSIQNTGSIGTQPFCDVSLGDARSTTAVFPMTGGHPIPLTLMTVGRASNHARARVRCRGNYASVDGDLEVEGLRILAIEAGKVTTRDLPGGPATTSGSLNAGIRVVAGHLGGTAFAGSPGDGVIAQMPVPAGAWVLLATARVSNEVVGDQLVHCRLNAGGDYDDAEVLLEQQNYTGAIQVMTFAVAHSYEAPGQASLSCGSTDASAAAVGPVQLLVLRAGVLTNRGPSGAWTVGDAANGPRMLVGWNDGPIGLTAVPSTIGALSVPKGAWAGLGKAWVTRLTGDHGDASCQVRFGSAPTSRSTAHLLTPGYSNPLTHAVLAAAPAGSLTSPAQMTMDCEGEATDGDVVARFLKMVAIRGGSVTRRAA